MIELKYTTNGQGSYVVTNYNDQYMFNRVCDPEASLLVHVPLSDNSHVKDYYCVVSLQCWAFTGGYKQSLMLTDNTDKLLTKHVDIYGISLEKSHTQLKETIENSSRNKAQIAVMIMGNTYCTWQHCQMMLHLLKISSRLEEIRIVMVIVQCARLFMSQRTDRLCLRLI